MQLSDWPPRKFLTIQDLRKSPVIIAGSLAVLTVGTLIYFSFFNTNRESKKAKITDCDIKKSDPTLSSTGTSSKTLTDTKTNKDTNEQSQKTKTSTATATLHDSKATTDTSKTANETANEKEPLSESVTINKEITIETRTDNAKETSDVIVETTTTTKDTSEKVVDHFTIESKTTKTDNGTVSSCMEDSMVILESTDDLMDKKNTGMEDSIVILDLTQSTLEEAPVSLTKEIVQELKDELKEKLEMKASDEPENELKAVEDDNQEESKEATKEEIEEESNVLPTDKLKRLSKEDFEMVAKDELKELIKEKPKEQEQPEIIQKDIKKSTTSSLPTYMHIPKAFVPSATIENKAVTPPFSMAPSKASSSSSVPSIIPDDISSSASQLPRNSNLPSTGHYWAQQQGQPLPLYNMQWPHIFNIEQEQIRQPHTQPLPNSFEDKTPIQDNNDKQDADKGKKKFKKYMTRTQMIESQHQKYTPPIKARCNHWPSCTNKKCKFHHPYIICRNADTCRFERKNCIFLHPEDMQEPLRTQQPRDDYMFYSEQYPVLQEQ
ncbi:hypothetical protein BDF14DRAFT_1835827 [Spinellus fusiger]|nr:hypothetical protein BDF14DRAFT_1835827 [Spinellus fusiger]